jgi:hypothetical protein
MGFKEYDIVQVTKDINPVIKKGMQGVILMKYSEHAFEVEFVKEDGTNYEYNGQSTFTLKADEIHLVPTRI